MNLAICSIASGSSGNCYVVMSGNIVLLVDAGISAKRIRNGLAALNLTPNMINGILVTHEHSDHVKGLRVITKATEANIYANESTFYGINLSIPEEKRCCFKTGDIFTIGDIEVRTFPVSHDSGDPVGYSFESAGHRIAIVTDTGVFRHSSYH
jgi:phosphoribosyl 1,2-cyclic phosphodiesterase